MTKTAKPTWTTVELPAEITGRDNDATRALLGGLVQKGTHIVADAAKLKFIDSTGIGLMVQFLREAKAKGGDLRFRDLRGQPFKLFRQARLDWVFTIESGEDSIESKQDIFGSFENQSEKYNLELTYNAVGEVGVFHLTGLLCLPEGGQKLKEHLLLALAGKNKLLLDLRNLEYLDLRAAEEILNTYFILKTSGGEIGICGAQGLAMAILKKAGVDSLVPFFATVQEAVESWTVAN